MWILILIVLLLVVLLGLYWVIQPYLAWKKTAGNRHSEQITINYLNKEKRTLNQHRKQFDKSKETINLSLVIPSYNEEDRLPIMLKQAVDYLKTQKFSYEIIIVNDGSKDRTTNVALEKALLLQIKNFYVVEYPKNRGKGGAVKAGMAVAKGEYILMVDADGATTFSELGPVYKKMLNIQQQCKHPLIMVVGSRAMFTEENKVERKFLRKIISGVFGFIKGIVCGVKTKDTQCGFKLFTKQSAKGLFQILHIERWAFDIQLFVLCHIFNYKIGEVPVEWRDIDGSKLNVIEASVNMFRDVLMIRLLYVLGLWKKSDRVIVS